MNFEALFYLLVYGQLIIKDIGTLLFNFWISCRFVQDLCFHYFIRLELSVSGNQFLHGRSSII
jgi:hypothetical protein